MKKLILPFLMAISLLFATTSCETTPDCELNNYGNVTVKNSTGYQIKVDITWGNNSYNDERWLGSGGSTTYNRVSSGSFIAWASFDGYSWSYKNHYLSSCENATVTWYLNAKNDIIIEIDENKELLNTDKGTK